jgi:hypothetical protein
MTATARQKSLAVGSELRGLGVDYITLTQKAGTSKTKLHELCLPLLRAESDRGNRVRQWSMYQYVGYSCGPIQVGSRADGEIARLSGAHAFEHWTTLYPFASNCSRIDVQLTIFFPQDSLKVLHSLWSSIRRHRPAVGKAPLATFIQCTNGAWTIYSGQRSTERMGRIYDKGVESGDPDLQGCVRFEAEMKGSAAAGVSRQIYTAEDRNAQIATEVSGFLGDRGVPGCFLEVVSQLQLLSHWSPVPQIADDCRTLSWLAGSVRPSIQRLVERGRYQDVVEALGLGRLVHKSTES